MSDSRTKIIISDSDVYLNIFLLVFAACRRSDSIWRPWMSHWKCFLRRKGSRHWCGQLVIFEKTRRKLVNMLLIINESISHSQHLLHLVWKSEKIVDVLVEVVHKAQKSHLTCEMVARRDLFRSRGPETVV